jgi:hypothetical protein
MSFLAKTHLCFLAKAISWYFENFDAIIRWREQLMFSKECLE